MSSRHSGRHTSEDNGSPSPAPAVGRSLSTRMATLATLNGAVIIVVLLILVTAQIRDEVFAGRRDVILADAGQRVLAAQAEFDSATATTPDEVAAVARGQVRQIKESASGAGAVGVVMERSSTETSAAVVNDLSTDPNLSALITPELVAQVEAEQKGGLKWQSVALVGADGESDPGIVVGSPVTLPMAGRYDLYLVYSLAPEQRVIDGAARAVALAGIGFVLILILGVWALTWRVLIPVKRTSLAAERLAAGMLSERLDEHGNDELAALARSFNKMAASLESQIERYVLLSKVQRLFVSDVSHELRTPLTTIQAAAEQIYDCRDEIPDPLVRRSSELLYDQVDRLQAMLTDLLEISRIDSGHVELRPRRTDMREVVTSVLEINAFHVTGSGAQIRLHLPDEPVVAQIDVRRVERIIRNLVINALEHAESKPIDITVAGNEQAVAVRVRDHGVGMSPDVVSKVFDRFFRADASRKRTLGGTGLGLSISLEDAHLHGGTLTAWGWPSEGASFLLTLPRELGPEGTAGHLNGPGPLELVPEDAPSVARTPPRSTARTEGASRAVLGPAPVSRRSRVRDHDSSSPATAPEETATPGHITVLGPGQAPSAMTPDSTTGRWRR